MMRVLESWEYGDPEKVTIRREEEEQRKDRACGQCVHKVSMQLDGQVLNACEFKRRQYGMRCWLFQVRKL